MSPLALYTLLVLLLTIPFWLAGWAYDVSLLPGLPIGALAVVVPSVAAAIATARAGGKAELGRLFGRISEFAALPWWGWGAAVVVPLAFAAAAWIAGGVAGRPLAFALPVLAIIPLVALLVVAALLEEFGWTAFATDRLTGRLGLTGGALVLGLGWAVWHFPTLLEAHRGFVWIGWWTVWTVGQRVAMVALYKLARRNFALPVLFHAAANFVWQLAPEAYDPLVEALVVAAIAIVLLRLALRDRLGDRG